VRTRPHDEYEENIAAYVLGALPELEAHVLEQHLAGCESCRAEVELLRPVGHGLARSVPQVEPPASLKASLMRTVNEEAQRRAEQRRDARAPRGIRQRLGALEPRIALAGALAVLALGVVIGVGVDRLANNGAATHTIAAKIDRRLMPTGTAVLKVSANDRHATLEVSGAPTPPAGRVYQLWIQRGKTIKPGPVFTLGPNGSRSASVPGGVRGAKAVLVTVEKAGGAQAPTGRPVMTISV
jgi:anti-sigma-K factor RskA